MVYTHGHHDSVLRSHRWRTVANSAAYLAEAFQPGVSVLDVGCGPGSITADIAARVAPGRVVAVDTSATVLTEARQVVAEQGLDNVEFVVADVHDLRFDDNTFDVVHAHQVLQHVVDPVGVLREMRRVCRRDGVVGAREADFKAMAWYPETPGMDDWLALYCRVARANGGEPDGGRRLHAWARAAGFTDITCGTSAWCHASPEDRAWWSGLWSERLVHSDLAGRAVELGYATREDLARIADAWREWAADVDGWFAILHAEIRCRG